MIDVQTYTHLLSHPNNLKEEQVLELKLALKEYPYFQSARALYLKGLNNQDSFRYNNELKVTAAHTNDRSVLFDFITSKSFEKKEAIDHQIAGEIPQKTSKDKEEKSEISLPSEESIQLGKPLSFSTNEKYSFQEWLQLATQKPIERKEEKNQKKIENKFDLIDKFIQNNPKIVPANKGEKIQIEIPKNKPDKSLMTETLASVYLEQKKFSKAIKAYEILSLKYPEKNGFFADQIRKIRILQKNRS